MATKYQQKVVSEKMHKMSEENKRLPKSKRRSHDQMVAIALSEAGISKKKKK